MSRSRAPCSGGGCCAECANDVSIARPLGPLTGDELRELSVTVCKAEDCVHATVGQDASQPACVLDVPTARPHFDCDFRRTEGDVELVVHLRDPDVSYSDDPLERYRLVVERPGAPEPLVSVEGVPERAPVKDQGLDSCGCTSASL